MTRAPVVVGSSAAIAAIAYAVKADEGLTFLRCWQHGDFDEIRADWPDAPEAVFIGAEAFSPATAGRSDLARSDRRLRSKSSRFWRVAHLPGTKCWPANLTRLSGIGCVRDRMRTGGTSSASGCCCRSRVLRRRIAIVRYR